MSRTRFYEDVQLLCDPKLMCVWTLATLNEGLTAFQNSPESLDLRIQRFPKVGVRARARGWVGGAGPGDPLPGLEGLVL
eukprot:1994338-Alexandrium_andersonii.AAC.1